MSKLLFISGHRHGSLIFSIMIGTLFVLGILAISLNYSMSEKSLFIYGHSNSLLLDMAAMEVTNQVFSAIGMELRNPDSPLFLKVLKAKKEDFPISISQVWPSSFDFQNRQDLPKFSSSIQAQFTDASALENNSWKDPWEKFFCISVQIHLEINVSSLRKMKKIYKFSRLAKIHSLVLPIVSKFTLFVKNPEPSDESSAGYNCFRNTINGASLQPKNPNKEVEAPLILFNSPEKKMIDLKKAGYIFLGGDNKIDLQLTNGADTTNGETFHFYPINKLTGEPPLFDVTMLPNTFQKTVSLASGSIQGRLGLQQTFFGFYDQDNCTPPNSMNTENSLSLFFERNPPRTMDSSCLHLFGSMTNPTPALVVGKVFQAFAAFSGLTIDIDNDGRPDGLLSLLKQPVGMQILSNSTGIWDLISIPSSFYSRKTNSTYGIDSRLTLKDIFVTPGTYLNYASTLMFEPYNKAYENLTSEKTDFPAVGKFREFSFAGESVQIPFQFPGNNFELSVPQATVAFKLNLNTLETKDILTNRIDETFENQDEFNKRFLIGSSLDLKGKSIFIKDGVLELPPNLQVVNPGIIVVQKDIHIKGKIFQNDPKQPLTIVSMSGNITIDGINDEIQAYLIALEGSVFSNRNDRLKIVGGIAVKTLQPQQWKRGGTITYDPVFDFTQNNREKFYVAAIADCFNEWDMEIEK
ncbi:MAG: hypothetical protein HQM08_25620 [Candidatus Riflebacteria bacterium]|nr:hypothetical protein [Candidatus Riflebacteria bacterium]